MLDHLREEDPGHIGPLVAVPGKSRTDIAAGIQLAMATFPQEAGKQVVLFSDGNENLGNALEQAGLAQQKRRAHLRGAAHPRHFARRGVAAAHGGAPGNPARAHPSR